MEVASFTAPKKSYSCRETNHIPWLSSQYTSHYTDYVCTLLILKQVKVKVKFTLEQATKVQRGNRGTALLFLSHRR